MVVLAAVVVSPLASLTLAGCIELDPIELTSGHPENPTHTQPPKTPPIGDPTTPPEIPSEPTNPDGPWLPQDRRYQVELTWRRTTSADVTTPPNRGTPESTGSANPIDPDAPAPSNPDPQATELEPVPGPNSPRDLGAASGADLDLHLLHPFAIGLDIDRDGAPDGWFDIPFDVHWGNPNPTWDKTDDAADGGRLDRDDRFGPGPEVISVDHCGHDGFVIGVHAFADPIGTPMLAQIDVYLDGKSMFSASAFLMHQDFWEVGRLGCDGRVTRIDRLIPMVAFSAATR